MKWDDLRFFLAVARHRSLSAAAQKLGVDATTVGRRIDRLTQSLGTALFEITLSGHILSAAGEALLGHAEEVERSVLAARNALTGAGGQLAGTVRLSLSEGFARWIVAPHLPAFAAAHPDIALEIVTTNGFLNPSKREADLAIMLARPVRGPLMASKLTDYGLGLYAAPGYLEAHGTPQTAAQLARHQLIGYIPDFIYAEELRYLSEVHDGLVPTLSSSSINVQHAMTRAGAGVSVLPHFIGRQDGELVPLLADSIYIRRAFWTVVHRDLAKVARVRAVIDWLKSVTTKRSDLLV